MIMMANTIEGIEMGDMMSFCIELGNELPVASQGEHPAWTCSCLHLVLACLL